MLSIKQLSFDNNTKGVLRQISIKTRGMLWIVFRAILLAGLSFIILFPLLTKMATSVMTRADLWDSSVLWIPRNITLTNFFLVFEHMQYPQAFLNSLLLTTLVASLQLVSCAVVGYGFARFHFFGSRLLFAMVIFTIVVPPEVIIIPMYLNFRFFNLGGLIPGDGVNLLGTAWPFILQSVTAVGMRNGLFVYIMRQFFRGLPKDLEEAAYVDGAGFFRTFYKVMLPGAVPALITVFLFAFVWQWNDYYFIRFFMGEGLLLPVTLDNLIESILGMGRTADLAPVEASMFNNTGSLLFIAPVLILYLFLQRYFLESVERTGITG